MQGGNPDLHARERAYKAVAELRTGCAHLQEVVLPLGGAEVLSALKDNLRKLEAMVVQARAPLSLPWSRPLPEEQAKFEVICPTGGVLLRTQPCIISEDSNSSDHAIGQFFISDTGLLFENCSDVIRSPGLIVWDSIVDMQNRPSESCPDTSRISQHGNLELTLGEPCPGSFHIQLGLPADVEWIIQAWRLCTEESTNGILQVDSLTHPGETQVSFLSFHSFDEGSFNPDELQSIRQTRPITLTSSMSAALAQIPDYPAVESKDPLLSTIFQDFTFETMCAEFESEDWFIDDFMRETLNAIEMRTSSWKRGVRPGAMVRDSHIIMPVPPDVPRAVALILGMPETVTVTATFQFRRSGEEATLVMHSSTHGVPFGDSFRVEDTIRFGPHANGVEFRKWTKAAWIKPMSWTLKPVKIFLERKVRSEARAGCTIMERMLREVGTRGLNP